MDGQGIWIQFLAEARDFSFVHSNQIVSGVHQAAYTIGTRAYFPGIKWLRHEAECSPLSSVKIKNAWSYTSTPSYISMAWCLIMHWDNFTFICSLLGHDTTDILKERAVSIFRVEKQAVQINSSCFAFIFIIGVRQSLGTVASSGPTVPSSDDTSIEHCWNGRYQKEDELFREKPALVPLCSTQMPYRLPWI
jgi:hypothetical protein